MFENLIDDLGSVDEGQTAALNMPRASANSGYLPDWPEPFGSKSFADQDSGQSNSSDRYGSGEKSAEQPSVDPDEIARELGLNEFLTLSDLSELRRGFALRNHPDRTPYAWRHLTTERMSIANRLIDDEVAKRTKAITDNR